MTSICDERGQELLYAGMPITEVFKSEIGLGGTLGLLWFQRRLDPSFTSSYLIVVMKGCWGVWVISLFVCRLPKYACQFIEMCLMVTADHGPAVSGAHNTIVCARAGKDLISSLTSGLLTIVRHLDLFICSLCAEVHHEPTSLYFFRATALEEPWMRRQSSSAMRLTAACFQWSL